MPGVLTLLGLLVWLGAGCGGSTLEARDLGYGDAHARYREPAARDPGYWSAPQSYGGAYLGGTATGDTEAGAAFARWVLEQDPQRRYLTDAVVRGEDTLGVRVQSNLTAGELHKLLVALTDGMVRTFPGHFTRVIAFQNGDKLAEAAYNPRSRQTEVVLARH
jgi:hypothetical protein